MRLGNNSKFGHVDSAAHVVVVIGSEDEYSVQMVNIVGLSISVIIRSRVSISDRATVRLWLMVVSSDGSTIGTVVEWYKEKTSEETEQHIYMSPVANVNRVGM